MAIDGSDIQHNPLRDFVTPRDPTSPYGFLNYLKAKNRLLDYLNLDAPFPPRSDYARYVVWVARQFDYAVQYSSCVSQIRFEHESVPLLRVETAGGKRYLARSVSFAPGRSNFIPGCFRQHLGPRMVHCTEYRSSVARWQHEGDVEDIAIFGASQSAVELMLDLPAQLSGARVTTIGRSFGIKQKDLSPFTEMIYEPGFVDDYFFAPHETQADLRQELRRSNYGAADPDVISQLRFRLYEQQVTGRSQIAVVGNRTVASITPRSERRRWQITLTDRLSGQSETREFDAVILATGFMNHGSASGQEPFHPLLAGLAPHMQFRKDGAIAQARDYRLIPNVQALESAPVYLNGVSETTHGFGDAGSFSLLSVRAIDIVNSIERHLAARNEAALPGVSPLESSAAIASQ